MKVDPIIYYTTDQAAKILLVQPVTIILWINKGKMKAVKTLGGHRRILGSEINKVWAEMIK